MRQNFHVISVVFVSLLITCPLLQAKIPEPTIEPLVRVVDLDVGQTQAAMLHNGQKVSVTLLDLNEKRDSVRNAVRRAQVKVRVNGKVVSLVSSTYHLPVTVGDVQIDCSVSNLSATRRVIFFFNF